MISLSLFTDGGRFPETVSMREKCARSGLRLNDEKCRPAFFQAGGGRRHTRVISTPKDDRTGVTFYRNSLNHESEDHSAKRALYVPSTYQR